GRDPASSRAGLPRRCPPHRQPRTVATDDADGAGAGAPFLVRGGARVTTIGVLGAAGRMGREVCRAVDAADDLTLIAAVDPHHEGTAVGDLVVAGSTDALEGVELHQGGEEDAASGTGIATAQRIGAARAGAWAAPGGDASHAGARGADVEGIRVHGIRLPGLLAHQEVIFGSPGQTLVLRHD